MTYDCFISVVAPVRNDGPLLEEFVRQITQLLKSEYEHYELLIVDDGSSDDTSERMSAILQNTECVRYLRLSRYFGRETAIIAGLEQVIGDFTAVLIPGSDPYELIPQMVQIARSQGSVVVGVRKNRRDDALATRLGAQLFYWVANRVLGIHIPRDSTEFCVLSRQALNAMLQIKERNRYLRVFSTYIGYKHTSFPYDSLPGTDRRRRRSFFESVDMALNIVVANSTRLLRLVTWVGLLASFLNLLYMGYILAIAIFKEDVAEGWITLSAQHAGMFFFLFIILTVLGEYIGRILAESQNRPLYYVMDEQNSSVLLSGHERRNVVSESTPYVGN